MTCYSPSGFCDQTTCDIAGECVWPKENKLNDQSEFWRSKFGDDYNKRQKNMVESNTAFFAKALARTHGIKRTLEYGAGTGMNMLALTRLIPDVETMGVEINEEAAQMIPCGYVFRQDIFDFEPPREMIPDLVYTKGLAIHIAPEDLDSFYQKLYNSTSRWILMAEYYCPTPREIEYRGNSGKCWARDFAGEMLDIYPDLELVDYGFVWRRDTNFPQDDLTYFLMEKR